MDFYDFPYIGNNHPNWLYNMFHYFFQGLKPPTSLGFYHLKFKGIYLINDAWLIGMLPNILVLILDGNLKELKTWFLILSYTVTCINTTFTTWLGPWMYSSCSLIPDDSCVSFITLRWHKKKAGKSMMDRWFSQLTSNLAQDFPYLMTHHYPMILLHEIPMVSWENTNIFHG